MAKHSSSCYLIFIDDDDNHNFDHVIEISDDEDDEDLQLQEALMASAMAARTVKNTHGSSLASTSSLRFSVFATPSMSKMENSLEEIGLESSTSSSMSFCEICLERIETYLMFKNKRCLHSFCFDCISKYVAIKLNETLIGEISCPSVGCKSYIKLEDCREMLPKKVVERWDEALCEAMILALEKVYCPFKDCSAVLIREEKGVIRESECPNCHRLFCAKCQVPWHMGIKCKEYQKLNKDERGREDLLMRELAHEKKWKRCPKCKFFVEKKDGCLHITCRCRFQFCYGCGSKWSSTHNCDRSN